MKKLLLSLLLFPVLGSAQINLPPIAPYAVCDGVEDGYETFILSSHIPVILNGLNQGAYGVQFFATLSDAEAEINQLANIYDNTVAFEQTIYARVTEYINNSNFTIAPFDLIVVSIPDIAVSVNPICTDYITQETQPGLLDTGLSTDDYSFSWTYSGMPIGDNQSSLSIDMAGVYLVIVTRLVGGCVYTMNIMTSQSGPASPIGNGYTINGQDVTITVQGYGDYTFKLDNGAIQQSNVFTNVSSGTHSVHVYDLYGCGALLINFSILPAPTGEPNQDFTPGDTLADLVVEGENIQWYDGIGPDSTNNTMEAPLPITTALVDGTTYFATQTINGIESTGRLAVTVHLIMDTQEQTFTGLQYYPNPVTNTLTISNTNVLDNVTVYNFLGQLVLSKNSNAQTTEIDLSALTTGIYTVKVNSSGQSKTIKIQKN